MTGRIKSVEQALTMTGFARYNVYLYLFYCLVVISMISEIFSTFYTKTPMALDLGMTPSQMSVMTTVSILVLSLCLNVWGYVVDTRGRKKVLKASLLVNWFSASCAALAPNWIVLTVFKIVCSISEGAMFLSSFCLLIECTPLLRRSCVIILFTSTFLVSVGTMAVMSVQMLSLEFSVYIPVLGIYYNSWRLLCTLHALPSLLSAIALIYFYESPKYLLVVHKEEEALKVLRGIYAINSGKDTEDFQVEYLILDEDNVSTLNMNCLKSFWIRLKLVMTPPSRNYVTMLINFVVSSYLSAYLYFEFLPVVVRAFLSSRSRGDTYLTICDMIRENQNTTVQDVVDGQVIDNSINTSLPLTIMFAVGIGLAILNTIMNGLITYVGRKNMILVIQVIVTIAAACINFSPYNWLTGILFICILLAILNIGICHSYLADTFPTSVVSIAMSILAGAGLGGSSFMSGLFNRFLYKNCEISFYITTVVSIIALLSVTCIPLDETVQENKRRTLKEQQQKELQQEKKFKEEEAVIDNTS